MVSTEENDCSSRLETPVLSQLESSQSFNESSSTHDTSCDRESASWVQQYFRTVMKDGKRRRACAVVDCGADYHYGASHIVLRRHFEREHKLALMDKMKLNLHPESHIDALMRFIVENKLPYDIVDSHSFKNLMHFAGPTKKFTTRAVLSTLIITKQQELEEQIKASLSRIESIALTFDIWSSRKASRGFGCIMGHFINTDHTLQTLALEFDYIPYPHDAETILEFFKTTINKFGIEKKLIGITTDNASNNAKAIAQLTKDLDLHENFAWGFVYFRCAAHIVNLAVKDCLSRLQSLVDNLRAIVVTIRSSTKRTEAFREIQRLLMIEDDLEVRTPLNLKEDVETRWNSTYLMLERALLLKNAIDKARYSMIELKDTQAVDWKLVKEVIDFLSPFEELTRKLSAERYPTISTVNACIFELKKHLDKEYTNVFIKNAAVAFHNKLDQYGDHIDQPVAILATILDPRFKLSPIPVEGHPFARQLLQDKLPPDNHNDSSQTSGSRSHFSTIFAQKESDELAAYLDSAREPEECDCIMYWKTNKVKFPRLYRIAITVMPIQASSVACERTFSSAGLIDTPRRNRLSSASFRANILLASWLKHLRML